MEKFVQRFLLLWLLSCICAFHIVILRMLITASTDGGCKHFPTSSLQAEGWQHRSSRSLTTTESNSLRHDPTSVGHDPPKLLVIVTPTYNRLLQKAELTRQIHTFRLIPPPLHWIVVEDANVTSTKVQQLLAASGLKYTLLAVPSSTNVTKPSARKGVLQRNLAIGFIRQFDPFRNVSGVVYFADDDNTYTLELFQEMRQLKAKVGVWPVGFAGGLIVERPLANRTTGKVIGWNAVFQPKRAFPIDMAGFGVDLQFLRSTPTAAKFPANAVAGSMESEFLKSLDIKMADLEPLADACSRVLVWHTKTRDVDLQKEKVLETKGNHSYTGTDGGL